MVVFRSGRDEASWHHPRGGVDGRGPDRELTARKTNRLHHFWLIFLKGHYRLLPFAIECFINYRAGRSAPVLNILLETVCHPCLDIFLIGRARCSNLFPYAVPTNCRTEGRFIFTDGVFYWVKRLATPPPRPVGSIFIFIPCTHAS